MSPLRKFFFFDGPCIAALRQRRWKLVMGAEPELYDLEVDPGERINLAAPTRREHDVSVGADP